MIDTKDLTEEDHLLLGMSKLRLRGSAGQLQQDDQQQDQQDDQEQQSDRQYPSNTTNESESENGAIIGKEFTQKHPQSCQDAPQQLNVQERQQKAQPQHNQQNYPPKTISPSNSDSSLASVAEARRSSSSASSTALSASSASSGIGTVGSSCDNGAGSGTSCSGFTLRHGGVTIPVIMADDDEDF